METESVLADLEVWQSCTTICEVHETVTAFLDLSDISAQLTLTRSGDDCLVVF